MNWVFLILCCLLSFWLGIKGNQYSTTTPEMIGIVVLLILTVLNEVFRGCV